MNNHSHSTLTEHQNVSISENPERRDLDTTLDNDLVQLAGYHVYNYYPVGKIISSNGKRFEVLDTRYDTSTGLDALTVQNSKTGELIIVYVGSVPSQIRKDWVETNLNLIGDADPAQLEAAMSYFDDVEERFGEVSSVSDVEEECPRMINYGI